MSGFPILKYPRTPHLEGSRLQAGDEDLTQVPFSAIAGKPIVVEEKCDGANAAVSFGRDGGLLLQSRGHYLTGGYREKHFNLFKQWANHHEAALYGVLGARYILYGEWLYAKHTLYYDRLPHYFLEFDIFDREAGVFLDTPARQKLLAGAPVASVPVLAGGSFARPAEVLAFLGPSRFIGEGHMAGLRACCEAAGEDAERRCAETDPTNLMEGLYIKVEQGGMVTNRMKFVRPSFLQCVEVSGTHWLNRSIIPNRLAGSIEALFAPALSEGGGWPDE